MLEIGPGFTLDLSKLQFEILMLKRNLKNVQTRVFKKIKIKKASTSFSEA